MNPEPDFQQKCARLAKAFENSGIPHADRLVQKLLNNPNECFLNAITAWTLHKDGTYTVTDLEVRDGTRDVAIELNHDISMRSCGEMAVFEDGYKSDNKAGARTERDQNRNAVLEELGRLPDDGVGILLAWSEFKIPGLQDCVKDMSANKCVLNIEGAAVMHHARQQLPWHTQRNLSAGNAAMIYHAQDFQGTEHLGRIADILGYPATARVTNPPD